MFNKVLLTTWGFRFPCLLTTWHCILSSLLTQLLSRTTNLLPSVEKGVITRSDYFIRILPMAFCFAFGLVAGNMAYAYISLAYIQMIKAFTPVPLVLLSFVSGLEKPSLTVFGIVLVVSAGVTLSSVGELQFSAMGFALQLSAVLVDCFRMVLMNLLLKDLSLDSLSLLYYTAPPSAVLIFCGFLVFEAHSISWAAFTPALCVALVLNGLLAFSLNVAVIYLVSSTSAVVMSISGPLKDILIVLISVLVFHSPITLTQVPPMLTRQQCSSACGLLRLHAAVGIRLRRVPDGAVPVPGVQERPPEGGGAVRAGDGLPGAGGLLQLRRCTQACSCNYITVQ
jgi:drug/metabolite transporter (DMT)-like permease